MTERIIAVVVTYLPDQQSLMSLLEAVVPQVHACIVIDNGSGSYVSVCLAERFPAVQIVELGENTGIAKAQNVGVEHAKKHSADFVLLLDQDSIPAPNMVGALLQAHGHLVTSGHQVAAVGCNYQDERRIISTPFLRVSGLRRIRVYVRRDQLIVPVDHLVASGSLISMRTLDLVGGMNERLFIDYVDIDWSLRAKHLGLQCFGVGNAIMRHNLGDAPIVFLGKDYPARSPLRHYYLFRNAVWLYRQPYTPLNWRVVDAWHLVLKFVFYSLFARPRLVHLHMMLRGIWHGLNGRLGRSAESASKSVHAT